MNLFKKLNLWLEHPKRRHKILAIVILLALLYGAYLVFMETAASQTIYRYPNIDQCQNDVDSAHMRGCSATYDNEMRLIAAYVYFGFI